MRSRDRFTMAATVVALAVSIFVVGGAPRWAVIAVTGIAAIAAGSQVRSRRHLDGVSPLLVIIGTAFLLTLLQLVPLPDSVVEHMNPSGAELAEDSEVLLAKYDGPARSDWRPISLDPPMTRIELAKLAAYFLIAWMCIRISRTDQGRERLLSLVAGATGIVALIGIVHEVVGATSLFGLYTPRFANPLVMTPLLNPNHLASLMTLGAIVAAGLAIHERRSPPLRAMWVMIVLLDVGVCLATRSRGGVLSLGVGTVITSVLLVMQRLRGSVGVRRSDVYRVVIPATVIVSCALVLIVFLGGGGVQRELESTRLAEFSHPQSKYAAWDSALDLVREAPVLGVGRGAFESAFTRVHPASSQVVFSHAENEYLQVVVDWGIVGSLALAIGGVFALRVLLRRWQNGSLAAAAFGALAAVGVQSVVDFGLEMPGLAIPCLFVAATLFYVPLEEGARSTPRSLLRATAIALTFGAGCLAALPSSRSLAEDHEAPRSSVEDARAALDRHPLDYLSAMTIASVTRDPRERVELINHALRLHPTHSGLHRVIASWLASTGRTNQAVLEFRLALEGSAEPEQLVPEVLAKLPNMKDAAAAMPVSQTQWPAISKALVDATRSDVAIVYLAAMADQPNPSQELLKRLLDLAKKLDDVAVAERVAARLGTSASNVPVFVEVATMQLRHHKFDAALATLDRIDDKHLTQPGQVDAWLLRCDVHIARPDWNRARDCLTTLLPQPALTMANRRAIHARLAKVEESLGNTERAEFERKHSIGPLPPSPDPSTSP